MKIKLLLSVLIVFQCWSCRKQKNTTAVAEEAIIITESFDWLVGEWERSNEKDDRQTYENWKKVSDNEFHGLGFTLRDSDTIWLENIKLVHRDSIWKFEVTGQGESQPTVFRLTEIENERFVSENPDNEFPKVISYYREGNKLQAIISGGDMEITFEFVPVTR